jgi:hypothetical protein
MCKIKTPHLRGSYFQAFLTLIGFIVRTPVDFLRTVILFKDSWIYGFSRTGTGFY